MDDDDSDFDGEETKINKKDKILANNPEETGNPFKFNNTDNKTFIENKNDDVESDGDEGLSNS